MCCRFTGHFFEAGSARGSPVWVTTTSTLHLFVPPIDFPPSSTLAKECLRTTLKPPHTPSDLLLSPLEDVGEGLPKSLVDTCCKRWRHWDPCMQPLKILVTGLVDMNIGGFRPGLNFPLEISAGKFGTHFTACLFRCPTLLDGIIKCLYKPPRRAFSYGGQPKEGGYGVVLDVYSEVASVALL
ncbi:hypothetical protein C8F04DRAFT_1197190 [Mycena alexandri]|uniref:Uncharacterized protein n=1 Tax=Mycena alexandri TaxID=1745969 RepID=A0AAD6S3R0_9AGAR|nr:hypothetical protein C8F04DRAFT_1197190 [Mycena alexandri]